MTEEITAAPAPYTVGSAIGYGWRKFEANAGKIMLYGFFLLLPAIVLIVIGYVGLFASANQHDTTDAYGRTVSVTTPTAAGGLTLAIAFVLVAIYGIAVSIGLIRATIKVLEGEDFSFGDLVSLRRVGPVLVSYIVIGLGTAVGLVLCIIPGLIFMYMTRFAPWFILDKGEGPLAAIGSSVSFTKANFAPTFLFWIVEVIVVSLGESACFLGLLVALPVAQIATGFTYRRLQNLPVSEG